MQLCCSGKAYRILPNDVLYICNFERLVTHMQSVGWTPSTPSGDGSQCRTFYGDPEVTLYADHGSLLVRSAEKATVQRVAAHYVHAWLNTSSAC